MKRYDFSLQPVLRVRRIEQDTAQAGFVTAQRDFRSAEAVQHETVERYRAIPVTSAGPEPVARLLARRFLAERTAASVVSAEAEAEQARARMDEELRELHAARMRTAALEHLDERRREEHALEARRAEDTEVDELVTTRHGRTT